MKLLIILLCACCNMALGVRCHEIYPLKIIEGDLFVLKDILHHEDFLPVHEGRKFKKSDLFIPKENVKCGDDFLMHTLDGRSNEWRVLDNNGEEIAVVSIYLFNNTSDARNALVTQFCEFCALKIGERWGKEKEGTSGTWFVHYMDQGKIGAPLFASRGNLGMSFITSNSNVKLADHTIECLFDIFLDQKKHISGEEELKGVLKKRKERQRKRELEKEEELRKRDELRGLEKWKKEPCYEMPLLCGEVMAYDSFRAPVELLKHQEALSEELVIPNMHEGTITLDVLKKWGGNRFQVKSLGCRRNGVHAALIPSEALKKNMGPDSRVEILVAYARNRKEAMDMLLKVRFYDPRKTNRDPRDVAAFTVIKPGKVGDFDLGCGGVLGPDGALVKGSDQSAVYFLRGNTAVMVLSTDPGYSVMGIARKLDAVLNDKKGNAFSESK